MAKMQIPDRWLPKVRFPQGFRFIPTDEQLVTYFLTKKQASEHLPIDYIIDDNLYSYDPWVLPDRDLFEENEWYFYSTSTSDKKPNECDTTTGCWRAIETDQPIHDSNGNLVGTKNTLVHFLRDPNETMTDWCLDEHFLIGQQEGHKQTCEHHQNNEEKTDTVIFFIGCGLYRA
ncbi:hypothetical protein AMTRI_Chr10g224770 [Amborella trichopoda]